MSACPHFFAAAGATPVAANFLCVSTADPRVMLDLSSPWVWGTATAAALCVGMAKTGFGGLGIVAVSLFAQLLPARQSLLSINSIDEYKVVESISYIRFSFCCLLFC